ncbi:MAG: DUF2520 domain-containing protein [Bacteroidota bacterium]
MKRIDDITLIGAGAVGLSIALGLFSHGIGLSGIYSAGGVSAKKLGKKVRMNRCGKISELTTVGEVVILAVPDSQIRIVADHLAQSVSSLQGRVVVHLSGALNSSELEVLRKKKAAVGSFHPMQTFPRSHPASFAGVWCAAEGDAGALRVMKQLSKILGANVFEISKKEKVLYHTAGVFASNYLVVLMAAVNEIASGLRLPQSDIWKVYLPIMRQTLNNVVSTTPRRALTGPIVRGDLVTVKNHLNALSKRPLQHLVQLYSALGVEAARIAKENDAR